MPTNRLPTIGRILSRLDMMPPFFVYYAAGHGQLNSKRSHSKFAAPHLSMEELSNRSGISQRTICRLASQITWDNVKVKHIEPFCRACGVDIFDLKYFRYYVRLTVNTKRPYSHLTKPQLRRFNFLCERYFKLMEERSNDKPKADA